MADRVVRLSDGRIAGVDRNAHRLAPRGSPVVSRSPRMSALDRKLLRDVWEMKGQALAIAAVIGAGVTMFITYLSTFDSLGADARRLLRAATLRRRLRFGQAGAAAAGGTAGRHSRR